VIVVCGEALVDRIHTPDGAQHDVPGGGPFNTARALGRLGVPAAFLGHLSTDESGRDLAALLEEDGVSLTFATFGSEPTTTAVANVDSQGLAHYRFLVQGTSAPNLTAEMIPHDFSAEVTALHLGTLGLVLEPMARTLVDLADREQGRRLIMLDPNIRVGLGSDSDHREKVMNVLRRSTIVKASDADLVWLYPGLDHEGAAARVLAEGVSLVVVTLGVEGAFGTHRELRVRVPAPHVHVVDTIGAGDAFGAALLAWLHDHHCLRPVLRLDESELRAALEFACLAAAVTCTRAGADPPRRSEMVLG
jgi:fructokinase